MKVADLINSPNLGSEYLEIMNNQATIGQPRVGDRGLAKNVRSPKSEDDELLSQPYQAYHP